MHVPACLFSKLFLVAMETNQLTSRWLLLVCCAAMLCAADMWSELNLPKEHIPYFFNNNKDYSTACREDQNCPYKVGPLTGKSMHCTELEKCSWPNMQTFGLNQKHRYGIHEISLYGPCIFRHFLLSYRNTSTQPNAGAMSKTVQLNTACQHLSVSTSVGPCGICGIAPLHYLSPILWYHSYNCLNPILWVLQL